jgi:hypothetical protein
MVLAAPVLLALFTLVPRYCCQDDDYGKVDLVEKLPHGRMAINPVQ